MKLLFLIWREWRLRYGRAILTALSVAFAVAIVFGSSLAASMVRRAYSSVSQALEGPPALEIVAEKGGRFELDSIPNSKKPEVGQPMDAPAVSGHFDSLQRQRLANDCLGIGRTRIARMVAARTHRRPIAAESGRGGDRRRDGAESVPHGPLPRQHARPAGRDGASKWSASSPRAPFANMATASRSPCRSRPRKRRSAWRGRLTACGSYSIRPSIAITAQRQIAAQLPPNLLVCACGRPHASGRGDSSLDRIGAAIRLRAGSGYGGVYHRQHAADEFQRTPLAIRRDAGNRRDFAANPAAGDDRRIGVRRAGFDSRHSRRIGLGDCAFPGDAIAARREIAAGLAGMGIDRAGRWPWVRSSPCSPRGSSPGNRGSFLRWKAFKA